MLTIFVSQMKSYVMKIVSIEESLYEAMLNLIEMLISDLLTWRNSDCRDFEAHHQFSSRINRLSIINLFDNLC